MSTPGQALRTLPLVQVCWKTGQLSRALPSWIASTWWLPARTAVAPSGRASSRCSRFRLAARRWQVWLWYFRSRSGNAHQFSNVFAGAKAHLFEDLCKFFGSETILVITLMAKRRMYGHCWLEDDMETKNRLKSQVREQAPKEEGKQEGEQEGFC